MLSKYYQTSLFIYVKLWYNRNRGDFMAYHVMNRDEFQNYLQKKS